MLISKKLSICNMLLHCLILISYVVYQYVKYALLSVLAIMTICSDFFYLWKFATNGTSPLTKLGIFNFIYNHININNPVISS